MQQVFKLPMGLERKHIRRESQSCRPSVAAVVAVFIEQCRECAIGIGVSEVVRECREQSHRNSHEQSHCALMRAEFQTNRLPLAIGLVKRVQHRLGISRASVVVGRGGNLEQHRLSIPVPSVPTTANVTTQDFQLRTRPGVFVVERRRGAELLPITAIRPRCQIARRSLA